MRAVGLKKNIETDLLHKKVKSGEIYITASDGLFDMVEDTTIRRIVSEYQNKLDQLPDRLIAEANKNGGRDNITVLVSKVAA
jgi:protein phosphatase